MDKLWAPWRIGYIQAKKEKRCIFCIGRRSNTKSYVILKNRYSFAILNRYPYNNGHLLIAPLRHVKDISLLKGEEILDIFKTLKEAKKILNRVLNPSGFNIGINISAVAGAGITQHLHIHIVPRYRGDTNFMPVIYNTKIISQSLDDLFKKLRHANAKGNKRIRR
jgi:ATP adenylyltransferase